MTSADRRVILVTFPLQDLSDLERVREAAPGWDVRYVPFMLDMAARRRRATAPLEELRAYPDEFPQVFLDTLPEVEAMLGLDVPIDILERAPKLRWVQNIGSGTDQYRGTGILESPVILTSAKGLTARIIAEFVLAQLLALAKQFPTRFEAQRRHEWKWLKNVELYGRTLGILGLGEIGSEVARLAKPFGIHVLAIKRTRLSEGSPPNVDVLYPREELNSMLAACDFLLIAVPYTPQTVGMVGAAELAALPKGAFLLDVSRGGVLQEEAFIAAMQSGHLAGAALDVFGQEPLPLDSPLWDLPNLIISPHNAGDLPNYGRSAVDRFIENLGHYLRGEPLLHEVTAEAGY
jgi:phosphoglycerate dehydrogenase-like enzyme